jgi:hypothetical protein
MSNFDLRNHSVIDSKDMQKFEKTQYDTTKFSQAKPYMNYVQMRQQNQLNTNLPLNDRTYRNASMSVNNEQLQRIAKNEEANGFSAR